MSTSTTPSINLVDIRIPGTGALPVSAPRLPCHRVGEKFLRGPIPWDWLALAGRQPGKGLQVGIALWQKAGCSKSAVVKLCQGKLGDLGLTDQACRRAVRRLEAVNLVSVKKMNGRGLQVTILAVPALPEVPTKGTQEVADHG